MPPSDDPKSREVEQLERRVRELEQRVAELSGPSSEAQNYRSLFENAGDPIFVIDPVSLCVVDANPQACKVLGYSRQEMVGSSLSRFSVGVSPTRFAQELNQLDDDVQALLRTIHRRRDGSELPVEIRVSIGRREGRRVFHALVRDLTERLELDEARRKADAAFRRAGRMARVGAWELDLKTMIPTLSAEVARLFGVPADEPPTVQQSLLFFEPAARPVIAGAVQRAVQQGTPYDMELPFVNRSGQRLWVRTLGEVEIEQGKPTRLLNAVQDITVRKHAELLRETAARLQADTRALTASDTQQRLLESLLPTLEPLRIPRSLCQVVFLDPTEREPDQRWTVTGLGRLEVSDAPAELSAALRSLPTTGDPTATYRGDESGPLRQQLGGEGCLDLLAVRAHQVVLLLGSSTPNDYREFEMEAARLVADQLAAAEARLRELAEAADREAQLRHAQKMQSIGRLAGGVAHDFNNLLHVIRSACDIIRTRGARPDAAPSPPEVKIIDRAAARAADLTGKLLAFSRKQVLHPRVMDLNETILGVRDMLAGLMPQNVAMRLEPCAQDAQVRVDPVQLEQVLFNLALNARDAMPEGGEFVIATHNPPAMAASAPASVVLTVSDNGLGMDEPTRHLVFEPFFTTKDAGQGTGLGLAMVHGTVTQSGGQIEVHSAPGRGTTFRPTFPCTEQQPLQPPTRSQTVATSTGGLILVVDDNDEVRELTGRILDYAGYAVVEAANANEALSLVETLDAKPDLLLTDVVMPGCSGRTLAQRLQQRLPHVGILFMSGYADDNGAARTPHDTALLRKPFSSTELLNQVAGLLAQRRARAS